MIKFLFPNLKERSDELEFMDLKSCDKKKLINTVKQFAFLNFLFARYRFLIKKYIIRDIKKNIKKEYSLLDIGAGGCDIPIWLSKFCSKKKIKIKITCIDNDKRIINYARIKCADFDNILIKNFSAFKISELKKFDYIFANHFLHHVTYDKIRQVLKLINKQTIRLFLISDIHRSNFAYLGYSLFTGFFFHNSFAFYDGRLSIKKGFKIKEILKCINSFKYKVKFLIKKISPARIYILGIKG